MKKKVVGYLDRVNPILWVCNHLFGDKHTNTHRMIIGAMIMPLGVWVSKLFPGVEPAHFIADAVGYAIHGAGAVPLFDYAICIVRKREESTQKQCVGDGCEEES